MFERQSFCLGSANPRSFLFGPPEQREKVWPVCQNLPLSTTFPGCPDHSCRCIPGSRNLARGWRCRPQTSLCGWWPHSNETAAESKPAHVILNNNPSLIRQNCLPAKNEKLWWIQQNSYFLKSLNLPDTDPLSILRESGLIHQSSNYFRDRFFFNLIFKVIFLLLFNIQKDLQGLHHISSPGILHAWFICRISKATADF